MDNRTDMFHWYPVVSQLPDINTPRTILLKADQRELASVLDHKSSREFETLVRRIREAADKIGWPVFMRTGITSHKHDWAGSCYLTKPNQIARNVAGLIEFSELADMFGLPYGTWAVREMLPTVAAFHAFDGMPVTREFRFAVRDGKVERWQPYWPPGAILNPTVDDWQSRLRALNELAPVEEAELSAMAAKVGDALPGFWSVDFLRAADKWWLIDMAEGEQSFWWDGDFDASLATREEA